MSHTRVAALYLCVFALVLSLGLAALGRRRRVCSLFALLMLIVSFWPLSEALQLLLTGFAGKWFAVRIGMISVLFAPSLWLLFVLGYLNRNSAITRRPWPLAIVPSSLLVLGWTTEWHGLVHATISLETVSGWGQTLVLTPGAVYWGGLVYQMIVILLSVLLILDALAHSGGLARRQAAVLLGSLLIPTAFELAAMAGVFAPTALYWTPISMALSGVLIMVGLTRYGLLDVLPLARQQLLTSLQDVVVVLDIEGRMVEINASAESLLGTPEARALMAPLPAFLAEPLAQQAGLSEAACATIERDERVFDVYRTPLLDRHDVQVGSLLVARDETLRERASHERKALIAQLQSALADVKTLRGFIPICSYCKRIRNDEGYWEALEQYIGEHSEAAFSHGLCPTCLEEHYPDFKDEP